jgi:hypothetical protein
MASEVTIDLHEPVTAANGEVIKQITLRAPTLADIAELGTMMVLGTYGGGTVVPEIRWPVLGAYIASCIVAPPGAEEWLNNVGLADTLQLRDAMVRLAEAVDAAARNMPGLPY